MKKFIFSCLAWLSILACSVSAQVGDGYTVFVTYADVGDGTTDVTIATTGLLVDIDSTQNQAIDFSSDDRNVILGAGELQLTGIRISGDKDLPTKARNVLNRGSLRAVLLLISHLLYLFLYRYNFGWNVRSSWRFCRWRTRVQFPH